MVNQGAFDPTKMWAAGWIERSSIRVPMATCTKAPARTTE